MNINKIRKMMKDAFDAAPDFKQSYVDNIACILMDELDTPEEKRNEVALIILERIFYSE